MKVDTERWSVYKEFTSVGFSWLSIGTSSGRFAAINLNVPHSVGNAFNYLSDC